MLKAQSRPKAQGSGSRLKTSQVVAFVGPRTLVHFGDDDGDDGYDLHAFRLDGEPVVLEQPSKKAEVSTIGLAGKLALRQPGVFGRIRLALRCDRGTHAPHGGGECVPLSGTKTWKTAPPGPARVGRRSQSVARSPQCAGDVHARTPLATARCVGVCELAFMRAV